MPLGAARHLRRSTGILLSNISRPRALRCFLSPRPSLARSAPAWVAALHSPHWPFSKADADSTASTASAATWRQQLLDPSGPSPGPIGDGAFLSRLSYPGGDATVGDWGSNGDGDNEDQETPEDPFSSAFHYGRWQTLSLDHVRLMEESTPSDGSRRPVLLIDRPHTQKDMALWACLLSFCHRTNFEAGTRFLLTELFKRRKLYQTDHPLAGVFWKTVMDMSVHDEPMLESLCDYAEWMNSAHKTQWPAIYTSVISFCLAEGEFDRAFRWHIRLSPNFGPSELEISRLLKSAIREQDAKAQQLLKSLYITNPHRNLYDTLIPFLWSQGHSILARSWRDTLVNHNDLPRSNVSRPFIRYLAAYFPNLNPALVKEEVDAAGLNQSELPEQPDDLRTLVNKVHGKTFGIQEKAYNDRLGSKWFASTWVSLDLALNLVHALGIQEIGPLSLQSIALREHGADGVLHRLEQLDSLGISVGKSRYAKGVRHLAMLGDFYTLQELLHSDIHPDVFDDLAVQREIMSSCVLSGDWKRYRLLVSVRAAEGLDSITTGFNELLSTCLNLNEHHLSLKLLDEMGAKGIPLLASTSHTISHVISSNIPQRYDELQEDASFYLAIARRMVDSRFPLSVRAWRAIFTLLSRSYRFDELEELSMRIIGNYAAARESDAPMVNIHPHDVPGVLHQGLRNNGRFQPFPRDVPLASEHHPVANIFDNAFQKALVRRTVRGTLLYRQSSLLTTPRKRSNPVDFDIARGVRLLAMIKESGVNVPDLTVRKALETPLVDLYGYEHLQRRHYWTSAKTANRLTLADARGLFNEAWGGELLPPLDELQNIIDGAAVRRDKLLQLKRQRQRTTLQRASSSQPPFM